MKLGFYRLEGKKAAIGFVYEDSTPVLKDEDESDDSDSGTDVEDADLGRFLILMIVKAIVVQMSVIVIQMSEIVVRMIVIVV